MTITGGSALPKEDIDRMMSEAEQYAEEDRQRREDAEARNQGDTLVYQTEKFLKENEDKVPADTKSEVESAVSELKQALEGTDTAAIKSATERVAEVSQKMGSAIYQSAEQGEAGAAGGAAGAETPGAESDDNVVDAEVVDEDDQSKREGGAA